MVDILTLPTDYERSRGDLPAMPIINMFAEQSPTDGKVILQSRPGVNVQDTFSETTPVRAIYSEPGVFNGDIFTVIGSTVYRNKIKIGNIDGLDNVFFASYADMTFITAGESLWVYNGTLINVITLPDNFKALKIVVATNRLVVIDKNTQRIYWSEPLENGIPDLNFAEAESSPDSLLDMLFIGDTLLLFGEDTTEFWMTWSSDPNTPFVPVVGRTMPKGIVSTGAATRVNSTFTWITNTSQICLSNPTNIISTPELEIRINNSTITKLWTFNMDQTEYLAVTLDRETWIVNPLVPQLWSKFQTYGLANWECHCYAKETFGSNHSARTLKWGDSLDYSDPDENLLERRFRAWLPSTTNTTIISNLILKTNPGMTSFETGQYSNPVVEMRQSKDGGHTWSTWRQTNLGKRGEFRTNVRWLSCGLFSYPGVLFEFRITDPVPFRVSSVYVNEPYGGF